MVWFFGKKMQWETICYAVIALLCICVVLLSCKLYAASRKKVSEKEVFLQTVSNAMQDPVYYVTARNDTVQVRYCGEEKSCFPLKNIDLRTMRNADRLRFESGFYLYSEEELLELLEDYSS